MITQQRWIAAAFLLVCAVFWIGFAPVQADAFLEVGQAFKLEGHVADKQTLRLEWTIAPGYKLYRDRLDFGVEQGAAGLGKPLLPAGESMLDSSLNQQVTVYHGLLATSLPVIRAAEPFTLKVKYQGCAEAGLCYPPVTKRFVVDMAQGSFLAVDEKSPRLEKQNNGGEAAQESDESMAQKALKTGSMLRIGLVFLGFGVLLSLTPCVLPMVPILSSIIVGQGPVTHRRGFMLAFGYSLGMALVYTSLGVAAGLAGEGLAGILQKPWVLTAFALLLAGMALSMFDVYQLQVPAWLQTRISSISGQIKGGGYVGVFTMGALSALIVGPCVAAPLAGALIYISQTHDALLGGWALFSMAMGMSLPLLLAGLSAGSLLPRAGVWMDDVKHFFGLMLIAVAIWMVSPLLPGWVLLVVWGAFAVLCAVFLRAFETLPPKAGIGQRFAKAAGLVFLLAGIFELAGAASGGTDVLQPLGHIRAANAAVSPSQGDIRFTRVRSAMELDHSLQSSDIPLMLDFYADWCVACKEMERNTFRDSKVADHMRQFRLLQVDVTANTADDRALMKRFGLFGPPAIILFNPDGQEVPGGRVIGFKSPPDFLAHLNRHLAGFIQ